MQIEATTATPNVSLQEAAVELREKALKSLFFFCKAGLGMRDLDPTLHGRVADFISNSAQRRKGLQLPRGHLKSSIATIGDTLHKVYRYLVGYPTPHKDDVLYILISMSTATNARKMNRRINDQLEKSAAVLAWWFPEVERGDEWAKDVITFRNSDAGRKVVVEFIGVGGRVSQGHYRHIKLDDLHAVEEAQESPPAVEDVIRWYRHTDSLLVEPGEDAIDLIGTHASINPPDVYYYAREHEGDSIAWLKLGCYDESAAPIWPGRFTREVLEAIRRKMGDAAFSCTYLNDPIDPSVTEFRTNDLVRYYVAGSADNPLYVLSNGKRYRSNQLSVCMTVDLAGWRNPAGDQNAIIVNGRTPDDMNIVLDAWKRRCPPDELIAKVIELHKLHRAYIVGVEEVAYQECLSYFLDKAIERDQLALTIKPLKPGRDSKDARIRTWQPLIKSGRLAVADGMVQLIEEIARFPKGEKHLLDCLAYLPRIWETPASELDEDREREMYQDYMRSVGRGATA